MWAILHIPTGMYLLEHMDYPDVYKKEDKNSVIATFNYYCKDGKVSDSLTQYIPYNKKIYTPDISEFEIVEVD